MANETVTKSKRFYCVSLLPDICKTPIGPSTPPIPYSVIGEFSQATKESPNVKAHSEPVILHNRSVIPTIKGDEPGKAGGIKSGTFGKKVETKTASKTYFANGTATVQEGCEVWMNERNTVGKIYERGGLAPRSRLEQIAALAKESLNEAVDEAKTALKPAAKHYKENVSGTVHDIAGGAMDKGGKVAMGGMSLAGAGAAATATGVGAPVGVPLAAAGTIGTVAGGTVTAVGAGVETGATLLDYAADYILSDIKPDLTTAAMEVGQTFLVGVVGSRLPMLRPWLAKGKVGKKSTLPRTPPPRPADKAKGGKTKKNKEKKSDKPSECCPKNKAPGGKPVSSRHPVHFGTGEEVLYQTDFTVDGPIPLEWIRCYRSGSELEDWGMWGARWATPFTASIAVTDKGTVYVDDSGRPMLLPAVPSGAVFDNRKEGFTLTRSGQAEFILEWRDGSTDRFIRTPSCDSWLPHGYDGVNAMRPGGEPLLAERYTICRMQGRDGRGVTIERNPGAKPGQALLRVRSDEGQLLEAMRDDQVPAAARNPNEPARIGRVEEVRSDGTRVCHVRYEYETETDPAVLALYEAGTALPARYNLARQTNLAGSTRSYCYRHHLLTSYTTYTGFAHTLQWISLSALCESWRTQTALTDSELAVRFPVTLNNSYQARATATDTADGLDSVRIAYVDEDTTRVTDANGGVLEYVFDANWLAVDVRRVDNQGNARSLGRRIWNADGALLAEIDSVGRATRYTYDAAGNLATTTDALGRSSRIEYDGHNQPVAITDPMGNVTRLEYDHNGNMTAQVDAMGYTTSYRYDDQGRLVSLTDAKGGVKQIRYDSAGRLASYTDCSGYPTSYEYDADGHVVAVIDALDQVTRYAYDPLGNMTSVCQADGATELFTYDADGRLTVHADAAGYETRYRYNGHGQPVERIDALGHTVQYRYDGLLQLAELINANGESYYFAYDSEGRLTSETGFDGKRTNYSYDVSGQLVESECAGNRIHLLRDLLGRLVAKQTADGVHRYAYDELDRLTLVVAPHAQNHFTYDALGRVVEERSAYFLTPPQVDLTGPRNADAWFVIAHAYDELGNRVQTILPNGRRIDILRYGSGHWHGTLWDGHTIVDVERDRLHREKLRRFGLQQSMSAEREYDAQSHVTRMTLRRDSDGREQSLRDWKYKFDVRENLLEILDSYPLEIKNLHASTYQYDPLGRLLSALQPTLSEKFVFDPAGNMLDSKSPSESPKESTPPIPITNIAANIVRSYDGYRFDYNAQGNLLSKHFERGNFTPLRADLILTYDSENRLIGALNSNGANPVLAHYFYDAFGRRIAKRVCTETGDIPDIQIGFISSVPNEKTTVFVWDGDILSQQIAQNGEIVTFIHEPDTFVPLAQVVGQASVEMRRDEHNVALAPHARSGNKNGSDTINYYSCDLLGTPKALLSAAGAVVWTGIYSAWGRLLESTLPQSADDALLNSFQPLRLPGQYEDNETGLYYNRYRYYDPRTGRYTSQDPLGLAGGLNAYAYAPNPTGWIDPRGLKKSCSANRPCTPCDGKNPSAEALAFQGQGDYPGRDTYENVVLRRGTILYSLYPGKPPGFAVTNHTVRKAKGSAKTYHELTQVKSTNLPVGLSMRTKVSVYRLEQDLCAAKGVAKANPQFGHGGATQYYISPQDLGTLRAGIQRTI